MSAQTLLFGVEIMAVAANGMSMVRRVDPDVIVGFGGYGSFPTVIGGALCRRAVFIHEQNSVVGKANRMLSRFARGVFVSYETTAREFGDKAIFTGNPSRFDGMKKMDKRKAREMLGLDLERKTVFIFGGSQGAQSINTAAYEFASLNRDRSDVQILHLAGKNNYDAAKKHYREIAPGDDMLLKVVVKDYLHEMFEAYCACDLVVCRAGATTIAEVTSIGIPAILVPYPFATADHQFHNARELEAKGAAKMIADADMTGEKLDKEIFELLESPATLESMAETAGKHYTPGVAAKMAEEITPFLN